MILVLTILAILFLLFNIYLIHIGARVEHFRKAATESIVVYIISNLPIILLIWASYSKGLIVDSNSFIMSMNTIVNGGEIFIYVSAILAPVAWALMAYFKDSHRVLTGLYLMSLLLILIFSTFSFQQARLDKAIDQDVINLSAAFLYIVSLMLWFGAMVYTRFVENYEPANSSNSVLDGLRGVK